MKEKTVLPRFVTNLLLSSGLRRLRQDLVSLISRLEGRRLYPTELRALSPLISHITITYATSLPCLFDRHFSVHSVQTEAQVEFREARTRRPYLVPQFACGTLCFF